MLTLSVRKTVASLFLAGMMGASAAALEASSDEKPGASDPRIGRYTSTSGDMFVLDQSRQKARLQFANSPEILILTMVPGPQGATYFKDEFGRTLVRLMPRGGATLYDAEGNEGDAYGRERGAAPLTLQSRGIGFVEKRSRQIEDNLNTNQNLGLALAFDPSLEVMKEKGRGKAKRSKAMTLASTSEPQTAASSPASMAPTNSAETDQMASFKAAQGGAAEEKGAGALAAPAVSDEARSIDTVADAVEVFNVALARLSRDELAREVLAERLTEVIFLAADVPSITLEDQRLIIAYKPGGGLEGRLSSAAIERYLLENL